MFGRENEVGTIVQAIFKDSSPARLAILGPGGIGKTSIALSVLHDEQVKEKYGDRRLFVSCEAVLSIDILITEIAHALDVSSSSLATTGQVLTAVINKLDESPFFIVLDNLETPWDLPDVRPNLEVLLGELENIEELAFVVTMRGSQPPACIDWSESLPPVAPIDLESAISTFKAISKQMDNFAIQLIKAVDRVPLAVTLLANLAAVDGETPEALWLRWQEERTAMIESGDDRLTNLDASIRLSLSSARIQKDTSALPLLAIIALLPDGMTTDTFQALDGTLPQVPNTKKAMSTLRQNSLVYTDQNQSTRILSPIRHFILANHPPSAASRLMLHNLFIDLALQSSSQFTAEFRRRLDTEIGNLEAILVDALRVDSRTELLAEAALSLSHYTYISGMSSVSAISVAVERLTALKPTGGVRLSSPAADHSRTSLFSRVGRLHRWSSSSVSKSRTTEKIKSRLPDIDAGLKLLGDCLGCWGQLLCRQSELAAAEEKFTRALQLHKEANDLDGLAYDLHNLGCLLSRRPPTFNQAEASFQEAFRLHASTANEIGKAHDLMGLGHVMLQQSKYSDAREKFCEALKTFRDVGDILGEATAQNNLGSTAISASKFADAEMHFSNSMALSKRMGDVVGQADGYAGLATSFLLRSRFSEARSNIEAALDLHPTVSNADHLHVFGRILIAQEKFGEAKTTLEKAEVLHTAAQDYVGRLYDRQYLAYLYLIQGNLDSAYEQLPLEFGEDIYDGPDTYENYPLCEADTMSILGMIRLRRLVDMDDVDDVERHLSDALAIHSELQCVLSQAYDHYNLGRLRLREARFEEALTMFQQALKLHLETENVQGQGDDLTMLAEAYLRLGHYNGALVGVSQALALHIQIGDLAGQGNDLYVEACVFLEQRRLVEAEHTIKMALELHSRVGTRYEEAKDLGTLSSILWEKFIAEGSRSHRKIALEALNSSLQIFEDCCGVGTGEWEQCWDRRQELLSLSQDNCDE